MPWTHPQHHAAPVGHTEMSIMQHMDPVSWGENKFVYSHLVSFRCSVITNQHTLAADKSSNLSVNPLTPELNPSAPHCLTRFFTGDFAS
jgi:hypothetical protein